MRVAISSWTRAALPVLVVGSLALATGCSRRPGAPAKTQEAVEPTAEVEQAPHTSPVAEDSIWEEHTHPTRSWEEWQRNLARDNPPWQRVRAADELGKMGAGAASAAPSLVAMLGDAQPFLPGRAALALGRIGRERRTVVPVLVEALAHEDEGVRSGAACALARIGPGAMDAAPPLVEVLWTNPLAADALKEIAQRSEDGRAVVLQATRHADPLVRCRAAAILAEIGAGARETVPRLVEMLSDEDFRVSRDTAIALGNMGAAAKEAVPALRKDGGYEATAAIARITTGEPRPAFTISRAPARAGVETLGVSGLVRGYRCALFEEAVVDLFLAGRFRLILDLREAYDISEDGVGLLLNVAEAAADNGGKMVTVAPPRGVMDLLDLLGVTPYLGIVENMEKATSAFATGPAHPPN